MRRRSRNHPCLRLVTTFLCSMAPALCQDQRATIHVEVTTESTAVQDADVSINGVHVRTNAQGLATNAVPFGDAKVEVLKDGFFPANVTVHVDEARDYRVSVELRPKQEVEEQITVHATRTDVRIQDSPTRVEVLDHD